MDRPDGRSPFLPTNQMAQSFVTSSTSNHRSSSLRGQVTNQPHLSFPFHPVPYPSPGVLDFKSDHQYSPQSLLDNIDYPLGDDCPDLESQSFDLLRSNSSFDLGNFATVSHAPRVSPHRPWNPVNVSMTPQFDRSPSELEPSEKKLHPDSGYASSQKSRQIFANHSLPFASFEAPPNSTYDEPIDSTAQQNLFLPEQQHRKPPSSIVTSTSPKVSSVIVIETTPTSSVSQSFSCGECSDKFNTKSEMTKHMARHEKKYTCDNRSCSRFTEGFATKNDLDRHKASVHHDPAAPRKEYKCCVPGCKDPHKVWDRKDNFKAHVKRMHEHADIDETIKNSFQKDSSAPVNATQNQMDSFDQDPTMATHMQPSLSIPYAQPLVTGPEYNTPYYRGNSMAPEEDDTYDLPLTPGQRQAQYRGPMHTIGVYNNSTFAPVGYPPSATAGTPAYASSHTMAPTNNIQDGRPIMPYQSELLTPFSHGGYSAGLNQTTPYDTHTAPPGHDQEHFPTYTASILDGGMFAIDSVQQTTQSGSWDQSSHFVNYPVQTAMTDQSLNSNLNLPDDEQTTIDPTIRMHRNKAVEKIRAILKPLPSDEVKRVVHIVAQPDDNKDTLQRGSKVVEIDSKMGFPCSRHGCGKTFSQNNIRTKHEQRHDRLFFCTFDGCYSTFGSKDDLRRHEKRRHDREAFEGWRCFADDCPTSQHKLECSKFFDNEEQFKQHRRDVHRERASVNNGGMKAAKNCHVRQGTPGPFWCGFCNRVIPNDPSPVDGTKQGKFRYDHIDNHVKKEKLKIDTWVDLKSEGLRKIVVKDRTHTQANLEDSQEDEEQDELTVQGSNTVRNTLPHVPTSSNQEWAPLSNNRRGKKRALSDAELNTPAPAPKMARFAAYQQRQAPSVSQPMTVMPSAHSTFFTSDNQFRQPREVGVICCCRCGARRSMDAGMSCGNGGCYHHRCQDCSYGIIQMNFDIHD